MPDTLFLFLFSVFLLLFLLYFPYIIWLVSGGIRIKDLILGRHQLPIPPKKVLIARQIANNYKESFIIFASIAVLSIVMGIPIQIPSLIWIILRIIYVPAYIFEFNILRTFIWHLSALCFIWMIILIILLNRLTMFY